MKLFSEKKKETKLIMLCKPLLYFGVCLVVRALWAWVVMQTPAHRLPWVGALALVQAIGFLTLFFTNQRLGAVTETGPNCSVWWHVLRPIHGVLYLMTAFMAFRRDKNTYVPLAVDASLGLLAGLYKQMNF